MKNDDLFNYFLERLKYKIDFDPNGPFFDMVISFLIANMGLKPLNDEILPDGDFPFKELSTVVYNGEGIPGIIINPLILFYEFREKKQPDLKNVITSFCMMLMISAYESNKNKFDKSPLYEFFRHIRNASAHNNRFFFLSHEPKRPAKWRNLYIDDKKKGKDNPLFGKDCFFNFLGPADSILLLNEVEKYWRSHKKKLKFRFIKKRK
jgi:hypothetical protein